MEDQNSRSSVKVNIGGDIFLLKSDKDPEYVQKIAKLVDDKIKRIAKHTHVRSQAKIAVLAALNIAEQFYDLQTSYEQNNITLNTIELKSKDVCDKIDHYLNEFTETTE